MDKEMKQENNYSYTIAKQGDMKVPLKIFASEKLMEHMKNDKCIQQGINVATSLPGILGKSLMMPDAHQGYGFSIGGVAAMDCETGCISPGGIGFDINCGVRLLTSNLTKEDVEPKIKALLEALFKHVPPGVGGQSLLKLTDEEMDDVLREGAVWAVKKGYGNQEDLDHCEENGSMKGADPDKITTRAKARGRKQLGTLGAGNHFLEIQLVDDIKDEETAKTFGITTKGQVVVMIHCGSRGLGHQVCSDYLRKMEDSFPEIMASLPEKDLIYAPAQSDIAKDYFAGMCAAANFAWANRHIIGHQVRVAFDEVFGKGKVELHTLYDVAHNIAKLEEHLIDGEKKKVYVHRKGATRAFPPHHPDVPKAFQETGQPIILPGSMGTSSYILVGTQKAMQESFGSTAHGAGRLMSRKEANDTWRGEDVKNDLEKRKIYIKAASWKGISEEAPGVYKDVDEVVKVTHDAGIGNIVARVVPLGVVKG